MQQWGVFTLKRDLETTRTQIESANLKIFEMREVTFLEKLVYCKGVTNFSDELWIVMFYATEEEYKQLLRRNDLTKVF